MHALVSEFDPTYVRDTLTGVFTLQNGAAQLVPPFAHVSIDRVKSELQITEFEPLLDYIVSWFTELKDRHALRAFIEERMLPTGMIRIQRDSGLFLAQKAA
jgi:hypothetical protein